MFGAWLSKLAELALLPLRLFKPKAKPMNFAPNVEAWRPLCEQLGEGIPIDFLLQWITIESGGNPCSIGSAAQCQRDGFPNEVGIFQLGTFANTSQQIGGVTVGELRAACSGCSQSAVRALSDDELELQVASGVAFITESMGKAHDALDGAGITWDESTDDFWQFVKMFHAAPAFTQQQFLKVAADAGNATSFADWHADFLARGHGFSASFIEKVFSNCERAGVGVGGTALGGSGVGGGSALVLVALLVAGVWLVGRFVA